jgi:serine protease Do
LTPIPWGDSNSLRIGDWVLAMGNPLDLRGSVSKGIVSAKGRQIGVADIEHLIQTDAMINPGNSGGPLVNIRGELVGINVAIATNSGFFQGIGFAIPSNDAKRVYDQIMEHGRILRGYVGVFLHDLEDDLTKRALGVPVETRGVVVINVVKDGPAAKAGVQMWDVITHVDDIAVSAFPELLRVVSQKEIGDRAKLGILRPTGDEPEKLSLQMEVTERPAENAVSEVVRERRVGQGEVPTLARSGLTLKPSGAGGPEGVEIVEVAARSAGARAGLRKGDIIMEIDHQPIASVDDARRAMAAHQGGRPMLVLYWGTRDRETREMLTGLDVD